jgi:LPXTG-site transpeptidase (sortase) family protein
MIRRLRNLDRQAALGIGVLTVALLVFTVGALGIYLTVSDNNVDLPSEGTITDIISDNPGPTTDTSGDVIGAPGNEPEGPPPPSPARLLIPSLYVDAPIIPKGVKAGAVPEVPDRPDQVAWYPPQPEYPTFSSYPGRSSNSVMAGHVDWQTQAGAPIPGVFYRLREMKIGQLVEVVLEDGTRLQYRVTGNVATKYDDPEVARVMEQTNREVITMITCGGSWVSSSRGPNGGNYSHRIIVRAERVRAAAADAAVDSGG